MAPKVTVTDAAKAAILEAQEEPGAALRVSVSSNFEHSLVFDDAKAADALVDLGGLQLVFDRGSAKRSEGLVLDFVNEGDAAGFKIDNPNAPAGVSQMTPEELSALLEKEPVELFDVRTDEERENG